MRDRRTPQRTLAAHEPLARAPLKALHEREAPRVSSAKQRPIGYLFLPSRLRTARFLIWLRRTHAWLGLWGAALALLFGATAILLNHRAVMKIPALKIEQSAAQLPLPRERPPTAEAMANWLQNELKLERPPVLVKVEPAQTVLWNGRAVQQPEMWRIFFASPQRGVAAEYWNGNTFVTVKQQDPNVFALLTRLHMSTGATVAWVLLADTLAGGLIVLVLSGILLWSRLHGSRLTAAGIGLTSLGLLVWSALQPA